MGDKIIKEKLEILYKARQDYKKLEKDIYSFLDIEIDNEKVFNLNGVEARIGVSNVYTYNKEFKDKMLKLYDKERKKLKPKEIIYVAFFKEIE